MRIQNPEQLLLSDISETRTGHKNTHCMCKVTLGTHGEEYYLITKRACSTIRVYDVHAQSLWPHNGFVAMNLRSGDRMNYRARRANGQVQNDDWEDRTTTQQPRNGSITTAGRSSSKSRLAKHHSGIQLIVFTSICTKHSHSTYEILGRWKLLTVTDTSEHICVQAEYTTHKIYQIVGRMAWYPAWIHCTACSREREIRTISWTHPRLEYRYATRCCG